MERAEINLLFENFNKNYVAKDISKNVELSLDYFDHGYMIADLCVNGYTYKSFSYEEILNYDNSLIFTVSVSAFEEALQIRLATPLNERDVYTAQELVKAVKEYLSLPCPEEINFDNPLHLMLYILDSRTDVGKIDTSYVKHEWLRGLLNLRLNGKAADNFYERNKVVLNFADCKNTWELYRELRTKMKFFFYYGDNLDALWDILTGMEFYGDDFIIKRKKVHLYIEYGRTTDFTSEIDEICELFEEASESIYSDITVKIEYVD